MSARGVVLYRSILKAHRSRLPWDLRQLGNAYVRNEFQLHKKVDKPQNLKIFFDAWERYLIVMESRTEKFGKDIGDDVRTVLSEEQKQKLVELRKEAQENNQRISHIFSEAPSQTH